MCSTFKEDKILAKFPWYIAFKHYLNNSKISNKKLIQELQKAFYVAHMSGRNYMFQKLKQEQCCEFCHEKMTVVFQCSNKKCGQFIE